MKKKRYTDEQIGFVLRQAETGTPIGEVCRKMGISEQTFTTVARAPIFPELLPQGLGSAENARGFHWQK